VAEHNLFYYPYASFTNAQLPLLKVAALYFDKLVLLDPVGASWDTVGADHIARDAVQQLKDAGILELVTPAAVLAKYDAPITEAIHRDMSDHEFLELCEVQSQVSGKQRWTLSLAKVPEDVQTDQAMRHLLGELARGLAGEASRYSERAGSQYRQYAEIGQAYDEYREGYDSTVEYRYADVPLALGEAIMMNHALFAGLLHAGATPITDDPFHSQALAHKLKRAVQEPSIRQVISDRAVQRQIKAGSLAVATLTDTQIELPILNPAVPLEEVLEYRRSHSEALAQVRHSLSLLARRIQAEPWSDDFESELETRVVPESSTSWPKPERPVMPGSGVNAPGRCSQLRVSSSALPQQCSV
jgi:hypothetical protein